MEGGESGGSERRGLVKGAISMRFETDTRRMHLNICVRVYKRVWVVPWARAPGRSLFRPSLSCSEQRIYRP